MKFEKMKVHHIAKTTKHTSLNMQHPDSKKQRREANCEVLENPLQPILCLFFLAIAWLSSHTTSVLQTTIKGWWWLSKRTTTLWDYSGRRNRFLRITYICPDEQKVSTIEAEGTMLVMHQIHQRISTGGSGGDGPRVLARIRPAKRISAFF